MASVSSDYTGIVERRSPRVVYAKRLVELGATRPDIVVLTADLGTSNMLSEFQTMFPERFFNTGVAEANMMSIAAGLALEGFIPFASTFAAFASMRACEQVRTDIAYTNLPVKILATMSGLSGGNAGPTHSGIEDMAIMRAFPNVTVVAPGDPLQMTQFIDAALEVPGPVYIRLGRGDDPVLYESETIEIGKAIRVRDGSDVTIIACGTALPGAVEAHAKLAADGIGARVIDMHTVKPLDVDAVLKAAEETHRIVTVEDHHVIGGLGTAVAEVLAEAGVLCTLRRLGVPDLFPVVGPPNELYAYYGYDANGISSAVHDVLA